MTKQELLELISSETESYDMDIEVQIEINGKRFSVNSVELTMAVEGASTPNGLVLVIGNCDN